jgi:hypothetical protein
MSGGFSLPPRGPDLVAVRVVTTANRFAEESRKLIEGHPDMKGKVFRLRGVRESYEAHLKARKAISA